jgi:hypothetical protein
MTHTVGHRLGAAVALSHTSAALAHGLALWEPDLSLVHVTRLDGGAGRTEAGVQHHEGLCLEGDAVFREKLREDALRETTGWSMVRLVWSDLHRPAVTAARLRRMSGLHAA